MTTTKHKRIRALARILLYVAASVLALVTALVIALATPGARTWILSSALDMAKQALPGTLSVESARWPSPGRLDLAGIQWTDGADSLLVARRLTLSARLAPLLSRDLEFDTVVLDGLALDLPALTRRFESGQREPETNDTAPPRFPRPGSLQGVPSIAVDTLCISARRVRIGNVDMNGIQINGGAELTHGHAPRVRVDTLTAREADDRWSVDGLKLDLDLSLPSLTAAGHGMIADGLPVRLDAGMDAADRFSVVVSQPGEPDPPAGTGVLVRGNVKRHGLSVQSVNFNAVVHAPPSETLSRVPALAGLASVKQLEGIRLEVGGVVDLVPQLEASVECTIGENAAGVTSGSFRLAYNGTTLALEDAAFEFPPLAIAAAGTFEGRRLALRSVVSSNEWHAGVATAVQLGDTIRAALAPVIVGEEPLTLAAMAEPRGEVASYVPATGDLLVQGLTIDADRGTVTIDADIPGDTTGHYALTARWEKPPRFILRRLEHEPDQLIAFQSIWHDNNSLGLQLHGTLDGLPPETATAAGRFRLPGPGVLAPLLPDSAAVDDLGPLQGRLDLRVEHPAKDTDLDLTFDFDGTTWVDSSHFEVAIRHGHTVARDAHFSALGLTLDVNAAFAGGEIDAEGRVAVRDSRLIRRVVPGAPNATLVVDGTAKGTPKQLTFDIAFEAAVKGDGYEVVAIHGEAHRDARGLAVRAAAPRGVTTRQVVLDSAAIDYRSTEPNEIFPARITVEAFGNRLALRQTTLVNSREPWNVTLEKLDLDVEDRHLALSEPATIEWRQETGSLEVGDVRLEGTLGSVRMHGALRPDSTDLAVALAIDLPRKPPSLAFPDILWPEYVETTATATHNQVDAEVTVTGFSLSDRRPARFNASVRADSISVVARVTVRDTSATVIELETALPVSTSIYPPRIEVRDDSLRLDLVLDGLPVTFVLLRPETHVPQEQVARLDGRVTVRGTSTTPTSHARIQMGFPDWPKMSEYALEVEGMLNPGAAPREVPRGILQRVLPSMPPMERGGVAAAVQLRRADRELLLGQIIYPVVVSLSPPVMRAEEGSSMFVDLHSGELALEEFDPLLPFDTALKGTCRLKLSATGAVGNADLEGEFVTAHLEASSAEHATVTLKTNLQLTGTTRRPKITGDVTVESALLLVPEEIKQLHPVEGKAKLWSGRAQAPAYFDTTATSPEPEEKPSRRADVDVSIHIPGDFRIRGRGLDLELQGDLNVSDNVSSPKVIGELRAVKGSIILLGRSLHLERGTVSFNGRDATNPAMDVVLSADVEDTRVTILIAGTVHKPKLTLSSVPEMNQDDIAAVLLFGRPFDDLSDNQADFVENRMTEMATALGVAALRKNISGVDVVSYQGAGTGERANTVTLGKYLNSDVLLSYIYSTEDPQGESFVSLEYFLPKRFKIDTVLGRQNQAGLGMGWSWDY